MLVADVLKVPHHGAGTSLPEFFHAVHAPVAVVSVGENDYGHPVPATLDHLVHAGSTVWRTDEHGTDHGVVRRRRARRLGGTVDPR